MIELRRLTTSFSGKILIGLWLSIVAIFLGFSIVGFLKRSLLEYFFIGIFPAAILMLVSIIISFTINEVGQRVSKIGWVLICLFVLIYAMVTANVKLSGAQMYLWTIIGYSMGLLSFPSCFVFIFIYSGYAYLSGSSELFSFSIFGNIRAYVEIFIIWLFFFLLGYVQWFKLLPWCIKKLKRAKDGIDWTKKGTGYF